MRAAARRQRHRGGRNGVVGPVVLAEAEDVEPDLIGELDLFQKLGEGLVEIDRLAGRAVEPGLDEGVDAELHEQASLRARGADFRRAGAMIACRSRSKDA